MKKILIAAVLVMSASSLLAQAPERTVEAFGDAMKDWCKTGDIDYRIKLN